MSHLMRRLLMRAATVSLLALLVSCGGAPQPGPETDSGDDTSPVAASFDPYNCLELGEAPANNPDRIAQIAEEAAETSLDYIKNVVIVMSLTTDDDGDGIREPEDRDFDGVPDIDLLMDIILGGSSTGRIIDEFEIGTVLVRLYDYKDTPYDLNNKDINGNPIATVWDIALDILAVAFDLDYDIVADLDYILADPYDATGSPYDATGSPYDATGSPFAPPQGSELEMVAGTNPQIPLLLRDQWAFTGDNGVGPLPAGGFYGAGTRIVIFDTSPFDRDENEDEKQTYGMLHRYADLGLQLCSYRHPDIVVPDDTGDIADHGLAVATLASSVAPESEIHLFRVLGDEGRGHVFMVAKAMALYLEAIRKLELEDPDEAAKPSVINLSLGFAADSGSEDDTRELRPFIGLLLDSFRPDLNDVRREAAIEELCGFLDSRFTEQAIWFDVDSLEDLYRDYDIKIEFDSEGVFPIRRDCLDLLAPANETDSNGRSVNWQIELARWFPTDVTPLEEVPAASMRLLTAISRARGATVVAAAGNDSGRDTEPHPSQRPAIWPEVISVGASNISGKVSCFSNEGDIYVPGGEGDDDGGDHGCQTHFDRCMTVSGPAPENSEDVQEMSSSDETGASEEESGSEDVTQEAAAPEEGAAPEDAGQETYAYQVCPYGLLSVGEYGGENDLTPFPDQTTDIQLIYKYFVGTSFATPVASGMFALNSLNVEPIDGFSNTQLDFIRCMPEIVRYSFSDQTQNEFDWEFLNWATMDTWLKGNLDTTHEEAQPSLHCLDPAAFP